VRRNAVFSSLLCPVSLLPSKESMVRGVRRRCDWNIGPRHGDGDAMANAEENHVGVKGLDDEIYR
jgi:hypothetical protein